MLPTRIILLSKSKSTLQVHYTNNNKHDKQPNLYFYLKDHLYPIVKSKFIQCQIITGQHHSLQKIILVHQNLSVLKFQKVLEFYNGVDIQICTMKDLGECLQIFDYLQASSVIEYIQRMIQQDIQYDDVFCLLEFAYNYGMQRVFDLCLKYLQVDQFQQIKYNKFDFLECNFKLFQIVLRRHHILKMKGQIQGLDVLDIQQVIRLYCIRNQIDQQIYNRLINKYVDYLDKFKKVKVSLRLDKLAHKNILQSANIGSDFYDNQVMMNLQELKHKQNGILHKKRKYSAEIKKQVKKIMKFSNNKDDCVEKEKNDAQSILQDQNQDNYNQQINFNYDKSRVNQSIVNINIRESIDEKQCKNGQQPDSMILKISGILNQYNEALNQHDKKYRNIRRNAQSTFFNSIRGLQHESHIKRIMNSSKLDTDKGGLFAIHESSH